MILDSPPSPPLESSRKEQAIVLEQQFSLLQVGSDMVDDSVEDAADSISDEFSAFLESPAQTDLQNAVPGKANEVQVVKTQGASDEFSASIESPTPRNLQGKVPVEAHEVQLIQEPVAGSFGQEHPTRTLVNVSLLELSPGTLVLPREEIHVTKEEAPIFTSFPTDRFRKIRSVVVISLCLFVLVHLIFQTTVFKKLWLCVQSQLGFCPNSCPKGHTLMFSSSSWSVLKKSLTSMPNTPLFKKAETELVPPDKGSKTCKGDARSEPCVLVQIFQEKSVISPESDMWGISHVDGRWPVRPALQMQATIDVDVQEMVVEEEMRLEAKTCLEQYCATMRSTLIEEEVERTFGPSDKEKIEGSLQLTLDWLNQNQIAGREEFEKKQRSLEEECLEMASRLWTRPESLPDEPLLPIHGIQQ